MERSARFSWWLTSAAALLAAVLLAGAFALALAHRNDLSHVRHLTGIWMALAQYLGDGTFYPPLEADGHYAGTRYMPVLFVFIAGLARPGGDYLLAAKLSALVSVVLLLVGVFVAGRRLTQSWRAALALTGLVLAFPQGLGALLSPHADALAVAFSLGGLLLIDTDRPNGRRCLAAALLFTAAIATKFSSLAGPAAAATYLLAHHGRRSALGVLVPFGALTLAGVAALHFGTEGRFLENFRSLGGGGMGVEHLRLGPARLGLALAFPSSFLLIWPAAGALLLLTGRARGLGLWEWYLLFAFATTLLIFTSPGTDFNHLLELQVAAVLVLCRASAGASPAVRGPLLWALTAAALLWGLVDLRGLYAEPARPVAELTNALAPGARLLGEDASVPVLLGQRPVVMDAFAFRVLAERGLVDDGELTSRIEEQQFDVVVMMGRFDREGEGLCPRFHFGPRVTAALRRSYRFERQVGDYFVYVPAR
jgi:hypothetical protein